MNRRAVLAGFATLTLSGWPSQPAQACSVGYKEGFSPEEIKQRRDVRKIRGIYRLTEITGERFVNEAGEKMVRDAMFLGTIEDSRGRIWKTIQPPPSSVLVEMCGCDCWYHKPELDATGTFWLAQRPKNGRYALLLWEGEYLPKEE